VSATSAARLGAVCTLVAMAVLPVRPAQAATNPEIVRLAGPDRYATAVAVSEFHHPGGSSVAVVASGADYPDAISGSALAGSIGAPLLLTQPGGVPSVVSDEIIRLDPDEILLLGGSAAVSPAVFEQLDALAPTTRIAGANRYATTVAISNHYLADGGADTVIVTTGADFPDALAGAPLATARGGPVLLTRPTDLPPEVSEEIVRLDPDEILLLGGTAAVSEAVFEQLDALAATTRIAGADRYATAAAISGEAFASASSVFVASGAGFADALAGAAAAAAIGVPVLLTAASSLSGYTRVEVGRLGSSTVVVLGGPAAVGLVPEHRLANLTLPDLAGVSIGLAEVASGFDRPLFVTGRPGDGRLFVVGQEGVIWSMNQAGGDITPVLDISGEVVCCGERGLLGIAFDPADVDRLFVHYSASDSPTGHTALEEYDFPLAAATADPNPVQTVLTHSQFDNNHNGGTVAFGPDGYLYLALGDGGGSGDPFDNGQDPSTWYGSILRIDVSTTPYAIPPDNPFASGVGGAPEVWAYGVRNPWRVAFDGTDLYVADVGQGSREEVSVLPAGSGGANLGWSVLEGTLCYDGPAPLCADNDFVAPVYEYSHGGGRCSISGGFVYRGAEFPDLDGAYFFGDFCTGEIRALRTYQGALVDSRIFGVSAGLLSSFGTGEDGRIYATSFSGGRVYRMVQTG